MSLHVYVAVITAHGIASNNRGSTEGNTTTLQKIVQKGETHSTVSGEAIRFALRRRLSETEECNRTFNDATRANEWKDENFTTWAKEGGETFIDDDVLGYMSAKAPGEEGDDEEGDGKGKKEGGKKVKGEVLVRRSSIEITRAVSLTPWTGDTTFNAASPGATPSAQKKGNYSAPYCTEMHATRYQYGVSMTPGHLRKPKRALTALNALCSLGAVAGNHARFLFDFSPESVIFRLTQDPAPRILYCYDLTDEGKISVADLVRKIKGEDILGKELILGGAIVSEMDDSTKKVLSGAHLYDGVMAACKEACSKIAEGAV